MQTTWRNTCIRGTKISLTNPDLVLSVIRNYSYKQSGYICLFGLYPLTQSFENKSLQKALNNSLFNPLHGKYIEFYLRSKGYKDLKAVDGVFMLNHLLNEPLSHFFYGTDTSTLKKIEQKILDNFPDANVCGYKEPPMIKNNQIIDNPQIIRDFKEINLKKPNIIWIGLGGVKQDFVMHHYTKYLDNSLLIGVGAVFDYFAGNLELSSNATKSFGLRWFHRLIRQPHLFRKTKQVFVLLFKAAFINNSGKKS